MDERMKHRAVGAVVIVALLVIFVPMLLHFNEGGNTEQAASVIPPNPQAEMKTVEIPLKELQDKQLADLLPLPTESPEDVLADVSDLDVAAEVAKPAAAAATAAKTNGNAAASETAKPAIAAKVEAPKTKTVEPKPQLAGPTTGAKAWAVQVGSFSKRENAERLRDRLRKSGYKAFVNTTEAGGRTVVRVRVGPELQRADADQLRSKIEKELQIQARVVVHP
jgi:DedD protein